MKKESSYKFLTVIIILISILFFSGCAKSDLAGEAYNLKLPECGSDRDCRPNQVCLRGICTEPGDTSPPVITFSWSNYGNNTVVNVTAIDSQSDMLFLNLSIVPACDSNHYTDCTGNVCSGFASSNCGPVNYTVRVYACDVEDNCNFAQSP